MSALELGEEDIKEDNEEEIPDSSWYDTSFIHVLFQNVWNYNRV